jgi:hypothetical protein
VVCLPLSITIKPAGWLVDKSGKARPNGDRVMAMTLDFVPNRGTNRTTYLHTQIRYRSQRDTFALLKASPMHLV